ADNVAGPQDEVRGILDAFPGLLVDDVEHLAERAAARLGLRPARQALRGIVHIRDTAVGIGGDDGVADAGERDAKPFTLRRQFAFDALLLRDVTGELGHADHPALAVTNRRDGEGDLDGPSILCQTDRLEVLDPLTPAEAGQYLVLLGLAIRRDEDANGLAD